MADFIILWKLIFSLPLASRCVIWTPFRVSFHALWEATIIFYICHNKLYKIELTIVTIEILWSQLHNALVFIVNIRSINNWRSSYFAWIDAIDIIIQIITHISGIIVRRRRICLYINSKGHLFRGNKLIGLKIPFSVPYHNEKSAHIKDGLDGGVPNSVFNKIICVYSRFGKWNITSIPYILASLLNSVFDGSYCSLIVKK